MKAEQAGLPVPFISVAAMDHYHSLVSSSHFKVLSGETTSQIARGNFNSAEKVNRSGLSGTPFNTHPKPQKRAAPKTAIPRLYFFKIIPFFLFLVRQN